MAIQITTTRHAGTVHGVKCLVYGQAGAGKTTLFSTAPAPLLISAESGLLSLRRFDIPVIVIRNIEELKEAYEFVSGSQESAQYATVGLDSLSEIAEVVLSNAKRQKTDPRQAYGELADQMDRLVRSFRDLPGRHVVMTAKMEPIKDEQTGITRYGPSMPGTKVGVNLPYFFDEVFFLGIGKDSETNREFRFLQTNLSLQHIAKDRSGSLEMYEAPDLNSIFAKILAQ